MNPIDIAALVVLALSAAFGLARGFVREVLGLGAWIAAAFGCVRLFPLLDPTARSLIGNALLADAAAYAVGLVALLFVFTLAVNFVGRIVRTSALGGLDRALGLLFGAVRGAALVVAAYVLANLLSPPGEWPGMVRGARATPLAYQGAIWAASLVPARVRPHIEAPGSATVAGRGQTIAYRPGETP